MAKKEKTPAKTKEEYAAERRQRFLNGATIRVNQALYRIGRVGAMANRATWTCNEAEAEAVVAALEAAVKDVRRAFFSQVDAPKGFVLPQ